MKWKEKFRQNNKAMTISIVTTLILIVIPIIIDKLIIGNNIKSNISNEQWVGFLGSYIGAIIGGIVSMLGIFITIQFYKEQQKKDELNANYPVLKYTLYEYTYPENISGASIVWGEENNCKKEIIHILKVKNVQSNVALNLRIENINNNGVIKKGEALDWHYTILTMNDEISIPIRFKIENEKNIDVMNLEFKFKYTDVKHNAYETNCKLSIVRQKYMTIEDNEWKYKLQASIRIENPKHIKSINKDLPIMFPIYIKENNKI